MRTLRLPSILAFVPIALAFAGCGNGETTGSGGSGGSGNSTTDDPCAAMHDECFSKQRVCAADGDTLSCEQCPTAHYASREGKCEELEGKVVKNDFADFTTKSGEEIIGLCQSWTLHNAEELWINAVELEQTASSHHSNWTFVPDDKFEGDDGVWPCKDRNYSQLTAALSGGVIYAQSTQATHEVQKFPNGAAVRIPPFARIIGDVHILNTTSEDVTGHSTLSLYTLPKEDVAIMLTPFHLTYDGLHIPPHAKSRFAGDCELESKFTAAGSDFKMDIYFVLPHYHAEGKAFFLDVLGGKDDGKRIFEVGAYDGEAHGKNYDPPFTVEGATGLSFGCDYDNPRDEYIDWGFGDQEMCETLGFAASPVAFESRVSTAEADGMDGSTQLFTGTCTTLAFKWDQNKPGGPGP